MDTFRDLLSSYYTIRMRAGGPYIHDSQFSSLYICFPSLGNYPIYYCSHKSHWRGINYWAIPMILCFILPTAELFIRMLSFIGRLGIRLVIEKEKLILMDACPMYRLIISKIRSLLHPFQIMSKVYHNIWIVCISCHFCISKISWPWPHPVSLSLSGVYFVFWVWALVLSVDVLFCRSSQTPIINIMVCRLSSTNTFIHHIFSLYIKIHA